MREIPDFESHTPETEDVGSPVRIVRLTKLQDFVELSPKRVYEYVPQPILGLKKNSIYHLGLTNPEPEPDVAVQRELLRQKYADIVFISSAWSRVIDPFRFDHAGRKLPEKQDAVGSFKRMLVTDKLKPAITNVASHMPFLEQDNESNGHWMRYLAREVLEQEAEGNHKGHNAKGLIETLLQISETGWSLPDRIAYKRLVKQFGL